MPAGCKESASRDGPNNIAAHFPENAQAAPDLGRTFILLSCRPTDLRCHIGPKMYAACGGQGNATKGTTNLHLDVSDAVNFITWTFVSSRTSEIWHIFLRHSISGYLFARHTTRAGDSRSSSRPSSLPLRSGPATARPSLQGCSVDYRAASRLLDLHSYWLASSGVSQFPACNSNFITLEQVRNLQNTIKVACDFVSAYNLWHMDRLLPDQRKHRLVGDGPDDVLQLYTLSWYAWLSVSTFNASATSKPLGSTG